MQDLPPHLPQHEGELHSRAAETGGGGGGLQAPPAIGAVGAGAGPGSGE